MRIGQLTLFSSNISQQADFYSGVLQLPVISRDSNSVTFKAGGSLLSFELSAAANPYHIAFNIPSNKAVEALNWLRPKTGLLGFDGEELIQFENWNAESMYFYDTDNNIVEFIARKNLRDFEDEPFEPGQIRCISEVGIGTANIEETYGQLAAVHPLPVYWGDFDKFCAAGDEYGLFILSDFNKRRWFPTNDEIKVADFMLTGNHNIIYQGGRVIKSVGGV